MEVNFVYTFANSTLWVMMYLGENLTTTGIHLVENEWGVKKRDPEVSFYLGHDFACYGLPE